MRKLIILFLLFVLPGLCFAQELNCTVQVVSPQIPGTTEKKILETLQTGIFEFMNNTRWTKDVYQADERIECSILLNVTEKLSTDEYKATIQIQSRRPIYKTSYNSVLLNHNDNEFTFRYLEFQPLEFSETANLSNLTSVLAFYANLIIGLDYDSYALKSGTPFYQKALTVVNNAQNSSEKGWKSFESNKNRYWLIDNLLNATFAPIRECIYKYHRLGLDVMITDKEGGRAAIAESLKLLERVHRDRPASFNMQVFFYAKTDEIINIFSQAFADEKSKMLNLLNEIDAANSNKYQRIMAGQ